MEMREIVDIYQARNYYFDRGEQRKLNFLCFDEQCRNALKPKVSAVNYWKSIEDGDQICNRPHFRENPNYPHLDNCPEIEFERVRQSIENETPSKVGGGWRTSKVSNMIDVFNPFSGDNKAAASEGEDNNAELRRIRNIPEKKTRLNAYKNYIRTAKTSSSILQEVVSCFLALKGYQRWRTSLRIGRDEKTYAEAFTHLSDYSFVRQNDSILYGGASISIFPRDGSTLKGYIIRFFDPVIINETEYRLSLYLSLYEISRFKYGKFLRKQMETVAADKSLYLQCYFWGNIVEARKAGNLNVELAHFNNLYLLPRPRKNSN